MFETIPLAIDGSGASDRSAQVACGLASSLHSEVVVLHVRERTPSRAGAFDLETLEGPPIWWTAPWPPSRMPV